MKCLKAMILLLSAIGVCVSAHGQNAAPNSMFQEVSKIIGKAGTQNADGSFRINLPRTDVKFTNSNGMDISPDLGLATYIAMSGTSEKVLAVGDVAMLETEIDGVIDALRSGNIEIIALHNHMSAETPRLFFTHFQVIGDPITIAKTFKKAADLLGKKRTVNPAPKSSKPKLDADALQEIFKGKPQVFPSGVLRFASPRKDLSVTLEDQTFLPGMGLGSWAAFSACECGLTMVMGDTCCVKRELQAVIDTLRSTGIHITAIHNHLLGGSKEVSFLHYEGEGDSLKLAGGIRKCWDNLGKQ